MRNRVGTGGVVARGATMTLVRSALAVLLAGSLIAVLGAAPLQRPSPVVESPRVWVAEALPSPIDAAQYPQLTSQRLRNERFGVQARMVYLPGGGEDAAPFNSRVDEIVRAAIDGQGRGYRPAVEARGAGLGERGCVTGSTLRPAAEVLEDPALSPASGSGTAIVCDIVAAQGDIFGVRLRVVTGSPDEVREDSATLLYADTSTGDIFSGASMWESDAALAVRDDIIRAIRERYGSHGLGSVEGLDDEHEESIRAAFGTSVPTAEGGIAFVLPAGLRTGESTGFGLDVTREPLVIELAPEAVRGLVTSFGERLLSASGTDFDEPDAVLASAEWVNCRLVPCVALTYDDGPSSLTETLLENLAEARAAATFYMLGENANRNREVVKLVAAAGHEIGGHTWSHPDLRRLDDDQIRDQIRRTRSLLRSLSDQPVASYRPPYGAYDQRVLDAIRLPAINWNVDTNDWRGPSERELLREAIDVPRPGGIILFHDTIADSVNLAPEIVEGLRDRGFTPVTITQLFSGSLSTRGLWRQAPQR